jgi:hypothetical protein
VAVGRAEHDRERDAVPVHEQVTLRAGAAPVGRIRPGLFAPLLAGMLAESSAARDQSMRPRLPSRSSRSRCSRSHTPARCQSRSLRQQVEPLPQPNSLGSACQGQPVPRTNRIPVSAARSGTRGRPPLGFGGSGGSSSAMSCQRSSGRSDVLMLPVEQVLALQSWPVLKRVLSSTGAAPASARRCWSARRQRCTRPRTAAGTGGRLHRRAGWAASRGRSASPHCHGSPRLLVMSV